MIDLVECLAIAAANFPNGPEAVAARLSVDIETSPLTTCEGWCVKGSAKTIIRVKSTATLARQRFTLAHELAHIIAGTPPDISPMFGDGELGGHEEEIINNLAAQMLLPEAEVRQRVGTAIPVSRRVLQSIAVDANISDMVVARRIVDLKNELGIDDAFLADFRDATFRWMHPRNACPVKRALEILNTTVLQGQEYDYSHRGRSNRAIALSTDWSTSLLVQAVIVKG